MDAETTGALRALLAAQPIASLGTLHRRPRAAGGGVEPFVSMVPVAWLPGSADAIVHVSGLASHTRDMLEHPQVSLMLMEQLAADGNPQALPRVTLQAEALPIAKDTPEYEVAQGAYLARFPSAEITFGLGDFQLFRLVPVLARFVAGFGSAHGLNVEGLRVALVSS
jgi:hypothetical protein